MTKVVVVVKGGLVQNVYAKRKDIEIEVIDLDVSDFPDDDEIEEKETNEQRLEEIEKSKSFKIVW